MHCQPDQPSLDLLHAYLVLLVAVEQQHIDRGELRDVSVSLELLSYLCADGRDGHVERVHLLDLGALLLSVGQRPDFLSFFCIQQPAPPVLLSSSILFLSPPLVLLFSVFRMDVYGTYRSHPFPVRLQHAALCIVPVHG